MTTQPAEHATVVHGLVLAGGASRRMGRDKAAVAFDGQPQLARAHELLSRHLREVFVSVRADQQDDPLRSGFPQVVDRAPAEGGSVGPAGPIAGLLAAFDRAPGAAWLVVACDLPLLDDATIKTLLTERDPAAMATAFLSASDGLPEPLCTLWEPRSAAALATHVASGNHCPRKFLLRATAPAPHLLPARSTALANINTPEELAALLASP
jgi:molybdenum cofactor guanylyltransferase